MFSSTSIHYVLIIDLRYSAIKHSMLCYVLLCLISVIKIMNTFVTNNVLVLEGVAR